MRNIPIPRFTQQDIIDKRSYIQASGAKHAKARRYRLLNRSLSSPSPKRGDTVLNTSNKCHHKKSRRKSHPIPSSSHNSSSSHEDEEDDDDHSSNSSIISSSSIKQQQPPSAPPQTFYFHHYDKSLPNTTTYKPTPIHSVSSFDASCVPSDLNGEPSIVKNSLDYLSYAIAMTEKNNNNTIIEEQEKEPCPDWTRTSQLRLSLSIPNSQTTEDSSFPSSPSTNVAAQAMLMFVNRESSSS